MIVLRQVFRGGFVPIYITIGQVKTAFAIVQAVKAIGLTYQHMK